jgi:hypothetical protein
MSVYLWGLLFFVALTGLFLLVRLHYGRKISRSDFCPKCGGSKFHRVRRHTLDRVLGIGLSTRRFRCANPDCKWVGLRQYYRRPKSWDKSSRRSSSSSS